MALIKADRVKESSTSTGASTFALAGAYTGFRSFSSVCSVGDTFYYVIDSDLGSEWETGLGTYSAVNTLTRTTVHSSSNSNNIVTFSAGTKNVYISLTGNQLGTLSTLAGSETLTNKTINASNNTITNVSLTSGVTGTLPLANGGTGTTTAQLAINALAGAVTSGSYLRGNGTNVVMAAIQAADVPTLNQSTTGTASGSVSGTASYLAKFTGTNVVGNSQIVDNATGVGIGVTPSVAKFEVSAAENADAFALAQWKLLKWDTTSQITFGGYAAGQWQVLKFFTAGSERVRIDASGNVGIGAAPVSGYTGYRLQVGNSADSQTLIAIGNSTSGLGPTNGLIVGNDSGNAYLMNRENTRLRIGNNGSDHFVIDATGVVGVNQFTPGAQLHVTTAAATTKGLIVRGASAQSANLQEWQDDAGTVLATVNSAGDFTNSSGYGLSEKFGYLATVLGNAATAIGGGASANFRSTAVGTNANASTIDLAVAIGSNSSVTGSGAVAIGRGSSASGQTSIAIGMFATAATDRSIAIGFSVTANGGISIGGDGTGLGYTSFNASTDNLATTGAIDVYAGDGVNNENFSRQHSMLGTWATATYASRKGRVQLRVNDASTDREAIRYESDGANALTSIGGSAIIANTTLAVQPAVSGNKGIVVKGASGQSANLLELQNSAGTALAVVGASGNVGIGTASPVRLLDLYNATTPVFAMHNSTTGTADTDGFLIYLSGSNSFIQNKESAGVMGFIVGGDTERMRIDASGNVGIGTTSPNSKVTIGADFASITGMTIDTGNSTDSGLVIRKAANKPAFGVLAWESDVLLSAGIYYDGGAWVHHNSTANNQLFSLSPGTGSTWYASNNSTGSWNVANSITLWNDAGTWRQPVDAVGTGGSTVNALGTALIRVSPSSQNTFAALELRTLNAGTYGGAGLMAVNDTNYDSNLVFYTNPASSTTRAERMRITKNGDVGIGTTSPSDKLHVIGNVRAGNYTAGGGTYLALTGDLPGYASGTYPTLKSDGTIYLSANGKYSAYFGSGSNTFGINRFSDNLLTTLLHPGGTSYFTGGSVAFGATTAPAGQLYVAPQAAATKGLVVRGASAQSANLQEWQSSAGTVLAYVNSAGDIVGAGIYGSSLYAPTAYTDYWRVRSFYRAAPTTVGNYIEICSIQEGAGIYEIYATSEYGAGIGTTSKKYTISTTFGAWTGHTLTPRDMMRQSGYTTSFDFELELHKVAAYDVRLRLRRTAGTSARYVTITVQQQFLNNTDITALSGTGTSPYGSLSQGFHIAPSNYALPVPGGSGAGNGIAFYAGAGETAGAGGGITLQPGNSAGVAAPGFINLNLPQPADGSQASCVTLGLYKTHYLTRTVPITAGDYVEICEIPDNWVGRIKISIMTYQHAAEGGSFKSYDFSPTGLYNASGIIQPIAHNGANGWELEKYVPSVTIARLRIRRTVTISASPACDAWIVIERLDYNNSLLKYSGTGTSAVANTLLSSSLVAQTLIQPGPPVANNGAGKDITVRGGNAAGTGAGGSILLQAGAFSTSGSNGKVIVRGLASNTANLQEWQNNAGSVLSAVKSDGSIQPASMADSAATNNSIYYSTTASKLVYKDAAGTVNNLY